MIDMPERVKNIWDLQLALGGAIAHYGIQIVNIVQIEAYVNVFVGICVGSFALVRTYYWIKNQGKMNK